MHISRARTWRKRKAKAQFKHNVLSASFKRAAVVAVHPGRPFATCKPPRSETIGAARTRKSGHAPFIATEDVKNKTHKRGFMCPGVLSYCCLKGDLARGHRPLSADATLAPSGDGWPAGCLSSGAALERPKCGEKEQLHYAPQSYYVDWELNGRLHITRACTILMSNPGGALRPGSFSEYYLLMYV